MIEPPYYVCSISYMHIVPYLKFHIVPYLKFDVKLIVCVVTDIDTDCQIGAKGQRSKGTEGPERE